MTTEQKWRHHPTTVKMVTGTETIKTTEVERLLGAYIHQDMKWTEYIRNNDNSLLHCLNKRLGALRKIAKSASFKSRLLLANGIFMSKLIFMIPLWAGCPGFIIDALQIRSTYILLHIHLDGVQNTSSFALSYWRFRHQDDDFRGWKEGFWGQRVTI